MASEATYRDKKGDGNLEEGGSDLALKQLIDCEATKKGEVGSKTT
jgi:hypothetical protein